MALSRPEIQVKPTTSKSKKNQGKWYYRLVATNGEVQYSSQLYTNQKGAEKAAESGKENTAKAKIKICK